MRKFLLALFLSLITPVLARADDIVIAVGLWIPPYVIKEQERGIEYDILKETLALAGHRMIPRYVPLARTLVALEKGNVDGIMSTGRRDLPGCYTDSHITYWNFAITLAGKDHEIRSVKDLAGKSIIGFQNARNYMGPEFRNMADSNPLYREEADQRIQNKLLFLGRTQVVVADRFIFQWYSKDPEVTRYVDTSQPVTYHKIFPPSRFSSVFRKQIHCDDFNRGLQQLRASGRYDEIISSYGVSASESGAGS